MEGENMELCSTYIETDKFNEVIRFYETVFQKKEIFRKKGTRTKNRKLNDFGRCPKIHQNSEATN
jgi:hypothetical protein